MHVFTGTWRLIRLALRRDRIKLMLWVLAIIGIVAAGMPALEETYGSPKEQATYVSTIVTSVVGRAYGGVPDGMNFGSVVMVELFTFMAVIVAFMSTLTVIRHTRQNEESGSAEMLGSTTVGRYAQLTAGILVAVTANLFVGAAISMLMMQSSELSAEAAWCFGATIAVVGIAFTAIAALTSQLAETARGANAMAGAVIGVAYLLRAIGDVAGDINERSYTVVSAWPSWLSPIGWGQQIQPLTQQRWEIFIFFALWFLGFMMVAFFLLQYRDVGAGIVPARRGRESARQGLLSSIGIAWRLQRGVCIGWLLTFVMLGAIYGGMVNEFKKMLGTSEVIQQYVTTPGGSSKVEDAFFAAMFSVSAVAAIGFVIQVLARLRSEETSGRMEALLSTSVSRTSWLFSHSVIAVIGIVLLMVILGLVSGITYMAFADIGWDRVAQLIGIATLQLPALFVILAVIMSLFAVVPQVMVALAWSLLLVLLGISQLNAFLKLPNWIVDASPFTHMPTATSDIPWGPIVWCIAIGTGLLVAGSVIFRRRNMTT